MNPYNLIEAVRDHTGEQPVSVTNTKKTSFTVKCKSPAQSEKINRWTKCKVSSCKASLHTKFNTSRGVIFLSEFDIDGVQLLKEELRKNYNVSEIERV